MYITKLGHSCVLVETEDRVGLFDAGAWTDKDLIDGLQHVDRIAYTHEHPGHFDVDILQGLIDRFPDAHVVCNDSVAQKIKEAGIKCTVRDQTQCTRKFASDHNKPAKPHNKAPEHNGYHFKDMFTHPGDSDTYTETKDVLAVPFVSRWGSAGDAIEKVIELQPKYVLPIHDWHYHDEGREVLTKLLEESFKEYGIKVLSPYIGVRQEIVL